MKLSKLVIAIFAMSAAGAMAHGNKATHTSQGADQSNQATASADGASLMQSNNVSQAQQALNDKGFNAGTVDGKFGPQTEAAVKKFQASQKLDQSGKLDQQTLAALGVGSGNIASASNNSSGMASPSSEPSTASGSASTSSQPSQASGTNGASASASMSGTNAASSNSASNSAPTSSTASDNSQASSASQTPSSSSYTK